MDFIIYKWSTNLFFSIYRLIYESHQMHYAAIACTQSLLCLFITTIGSSTLWDACSELSGLPSRLRTAYWLRARGRIAGETEQLGRSAVGDGLHDGGGVDGLARGDLGCNRSERSTAIAGSARWNNYAFIQFIQLLPIQFYYTTMGYKV